MPSKETLLEAGKGEKTEKVATTYRHFVIFERKKEERNRDFTHFLLGTEFAP